MSDSKLEKLAQFNTNQLADALHICHLEGAEYGLQNLRNCPKFVGRAATARHVYDMIGVSGRQTMLDSKFIRSEKDQVLVVSSDNLPFKGWEAAIESHWRSGNLIGTILQGTLESSEPRKDSGSPFYAREIQRTEDVQRFPRPSHLEYGVPVQMRNITVKNGDYVAADSAGVVFISKAHIDQVLEVAEAIRNRPEPTPLSIKLEKLLGAKARKARIEDTELVALFEGVDTAAVSDALDKLGILGQARGLMPLTNYDKVTVGPAFTVRYVPAEKPAGSVGDFIDDVGEGDVVVIDNSARTDCTVWGDIMTQYAGLRKISGTVIDGVCRDVNRAISDNYPLFTVGRWMRTGKDRVQVGAVNETVGIGGVHVKPRDIVVADANGVVFVPRHRAHQVAKLAQEIEKKEASIRESILQGGTLAEARQEFGYHLLQRHKE